MALRATKGDEDAAVRCGAAFQAAEGFSPTTRSNNRSVFTGAEAQIPLTLCLVQESNRNVSSERRSIVKS